MPYQDMIDSTIDLATLPQHDWLRCVIPRDDNRIVVTVNKYIPSIEYRSYGNKNIEPNSKNLAWADAQTNWTFHCYTKFKYDLIKIQRNQSDNPKNDKKVAVVLSIRRVKMTLSLPMTIWLADGAHRAIQYHEDGHKQICEKIYKNAEIIARNSCIPIIGKTFSGQGSSVDDATLQALKAANETICQSYRSGTVNIANHVSTIYDHLSHSYPGGIPTDEPQDKLVQKAFAELAENYPKN
jgi:hypothetical protein